MGKGTALTCGSRDLPESTQNLPLTSGAITTDATSLRCLLETLERQRTLLEKILGALLEKQDVRPGPAQGIFADYLRPAELAAEFRIRETQLFEWKRKGFGPPRTRIRQLVVYRRKGGSPRGAGQTSQLLRCGRSFPCLMHNVGGRVFYYLGELDTFIRSGDTERDPAGAAEDAEDLQHPAEIMTSPAPRAGPARRLGPQARTRPVHDNPSQQRGLIDGITWE